MVSISTDVFCEGWTSSYFDDFHSNAVDNTCVDWVLFGSNLPLMKMIRCFYVLRTFSFISNIHLFDLVEVVS